MATPDKIRNIILLSHSGTGKTSLAEAMLFDSGAINRLGNIGQGNTTGDYNSDEIERKISISSKLLYTDWKDHRLNLLDTPGYADFVGEVLGALHAADCALVLICGVNGVEVGTQRVWNWLEEKKLARFIFVNKLDKENSDFDKAVNSARKIFGNKCLPIQYPVGKTTNLKGAVDLLNKEELSKLSPEEKELAQKWAQALMDSIAESDDQLMEKYLEEKELTQEEIKGALRKAVISGQIFPVLCGSAVKDLSVKLLLDAVVDYLPSPIDLKEISGKKPNSDEIVKRSITPEEPFSAFVFKSISDPYVGHLTLFRIFSGTLNSDGTFYNVTRSSREKIGQLFFLQGKEQRSTPTVKAGDIAAVAKLKGTQTNDTICDEKSPIIFEPINFPEPAISFSVKPHSRQDEEKISTALTKLASGDPTFKISRDLQTKELIVSGMGDLHLDIMINRLKKRFNVDVDVGIPKVAYKETVKKKVQVQGKYKRQSGGRGQYGDCWLEVEPLPRSAGFEFVNKIVGGAIPRQYIPSVEKGVKGAMQVGILVGYPVVDIKVTLYDGSFHPVDSSDMAFQIAGSMAFKKAQEMASSVILEPVMNVEIFIPEEFMGAVTGDLNSRRGRILGMEGSGGSSQTIKAGVPLVEMLKYATELRSFTGGRGSYSMRFSHYEEVPNKLANTVISQNKKEA